MIFIVDIFGEFKDFALKFAYAAKSSGALTMAFLFKDYSDSVILPHVNENKLLDVPVMII